MRFTHFEPPVESICDTLAENQVYKVYNRYVPANGHDFDAVYRINRDGFRAQKFSEVSGVKRYATVGDSFTFGIGAENDQTFVHLLNTDPPSDQAFFNFSIPAFSTDQELTIAPSLTGLLLLAPAPSS